MQALSIGRLAAHAGVGVETIRFYEREGLIAEPPRTRSGYRQFPPEEVDRLRFIRRAQKLGFCLTEIRDLLSLRADSAAGCSGVRERADSKIASIDEKIRELRSMRRALADLRASCGGDGPASECAILQAMAPDR